MVIYRQALLLLALATTWFVFLLADESLRPTAEIEWADTLFEGFRTTFTAALLFISCRFLDRSLPIRLLIWGFSLMLVGALHDFVEELFAMPFWVSLVFENATYSLGILAVALGIYLLTKRHNEVMEQLLLEKSELEEKSNTDALTGAYNRTFFQEYSESLLLEKQDAINAGELSYALGILDLDFFKSVNDTHGHDIGDRVLQCLSRLAMSRLTRLQHFIRLGGEEFLILHQGQESELLALLNRIRHEFHAMPIPLDSGELLHCSFSGGVTGLRSSENLHYALKRADENLYRAKHGGRNRIMTDDQELPIAAALQQAS